MDPIVQLLHNFIDSLVADKEQYSLLKKEVGDIKTFKDYANKFYSRKMSLAMVAHLHEVHCVTVRKYVKLGLIETHPDSTDAKIIIRASIALGLDFSRLKKEAKVILLNN